MGNPARSYDALHHEIEHGVFEFSSQLDPAVAELTFMQTSERAMLRARDVVAVVAAGVVMVALGASALWVHAQTTPATAPSTLAQAPASTQPSGKAASHTTTPDGKSADQEDGQWLMAAKDYANRRYSGLNQITTENVKNLGIAWTFETGIPRGQEAAPLVVGSTMYVATPMPNILYALDLANNGALKWKFEPKPKEAALGVACCDAVTRGAAYHNGKVFINTLDCQTIAVDAESGKEIWRTKLGEINKGETVTMAPIVVKGKVLVGNSGGEYGVRGWLKALDENDGHVVWTAWSTGPDSDCLIGPDFKPYYAMDQGKDLGVTSWPPDHWQIGGATVWAWISYDPELNLIFYGTSNPGSWNPDARPGDNKWACGVFARDADTGQARWFYQWSPHDMYDHDGVNELLLLEMPVDGQVRKVIATPQRNGYFYILDRATGQVLSYSPFVRITSSSGIDLKTGRIQYVEEKKPVTGKVIRDIAPASPGGKDWQPSSFSPRTGYVYIPHQNLSMDYEGVETSYIAGTPYVGVNERMYANPGGNRGALTCWDPVANKKVWEIPEDLPVWSGTIVTAGDVVFYGTMDGWFKAVDARDGKPLWQQKLGSGIVAQPVTYLGPDGKQYVAILSGVGGWAGVVVVADLDPRDPTAATGFANAVPDLKERTTPGGTLYVFALR
jgi:PQQ-dependent dehydrogenase (methanol/ethanol family)